LEQLSDLPEKIRSGEAVVAVLGLGRVGLPLAIVLARAGLRVVGVDVDEQRVSAINNEVMPFHYPEIEPWLKQVVTAGKLEASRASADSINKADTVVVTVGTPTGSQYQLDYSQLYSAFGEVAKADLRGKAVIIRSTSVPGTMTSIVLPLLTKKTGLRLGIDFALAVCPERILEGQAHREIYELPEIVGTTDDLSAAIAAELFRKINPAKKILFTTPTAAELAKLFINIYRYVNFALANEFAIWAEKYGADAHDIVRVANEGYPRGAIPRPGFAGGPCLSKDGILLDNNTTFASIVSVAWKLNEAVPQHVVSSLLTDLGSLYGQKVVVLGLAFKANSDDIRLSPSVKLVETLRAYGADVSVHDPHVTETQSLSEVLQNAEVVILATNHTAFKDLARTIDESGCQIIYDVWAMFKPEDFTKAKYRRFGRAK
jgi:UDP-N-acetyl-D-mannosaminuronic acid dehydrogenase